MKLDTKDPRWPYSDGTLSRRRLLAAREEGRAVPPSAGPLLKCDPRAVRIAFWLLYPLLAVFLVAVLARAWGAA